MSVIDEVEAFILNEAKANDLVYVAAGLRFASRFRARFGRPPTRCEYIDFIQACRFQE